MSTFVTFLPEFLNCYSYASLEIKLLSRDAAKAVRLHKLHQLRLANRALSAASKLAHVVQLSFAGDTDPRISLPKVPDEFKYSEEYKGFLDAFSLPWNMEKLGFPHPCELLKLRGGLYYTSHAVQRLIERCKDAFTGVDSVHMIPAMDGRVMCTDMPEDWESSGRKTFLVWVVEFVAGGAVLVTVFPNNYEELTTRMRELAQDMVNRGVTLDEFDSYHDFARRCYAHGLNGTLRKYMVDFIKLKDLALRRYSAMLRKLLKREFTFESVMKRKCNKKKEVEQLMRCFGMNIREKWMNNSGKRKLRSDDWVEAKKQLVDVVAMVLEDEEEVQKILDALDRV